MLALRLALAARSAVAPRLALAPRLAIALVLTLPLHARAQEAESPVEQARALCRAILDEGAPGLSAAVARRGELLWAEGFGWLDVEERIPVTTDSVFRVGSIAKSFTAAGLALLHEEGRVDLDAEIQRYVPSFPEKPEGAITLRLLAGHLAGIRHYQGAEFLRNERFERSLDALRLFADDPLLFAPGERYGYTTYGYTLIAAAMEAAAEQDFLAFMDARVFRPLGMHSTVADYADRVLPGRASCYYLRGGEPVEAGPVDSSYKWAGGGFLSSASDLVRFGGAHLEAGFLRAETLELVFTPQRTRDGERTRYGLGWGLTLEGERVVERHHTGGSIGGTSALLLHPESGLVVALVTNLSQGPVSLERARELRRSFERAPAAR